MLKFDGGLPETYSGNVYMGIDQSYTGFAVTTLEADGDKYFTKVYKSPNRGVKRLVDISCFLIDTFSYYPNILDISMEGYAYGSQLSNMLGELGGLVKVTAFTHSNSKAGKYPLIVPPTSLKKYVSGKGNGVSKSQMLLNVYKKWGVEFADDNAADSYGLAHLVSNRGKLAYEKEVFAKLQDPKFREQ